MRISLKTTAFSILLACHMAPMAHAKLMKCIKMDSPKYEAHVSENEVQKYIYFGHTCTPLDTELSTSNGVIEPLRSIPSKPNNHQVQQAGILSGIEEIIGLNPLTDKECIKKIKENRGIINEDTRSCYNIFRYTKNTDSQRAKRKVTILSDTFGPIATSQILEHLTCSEIRDLNFAMIASSSKELHEVLRKLDAEYSRKMNKADAQEKKELSDELAKKIEERTPLHAKALCSLGSSSSEIGQMKQHQANMQSNVRLKKDGIYYFSEEIFHQINAVTYGRDISVGKANDRSHGLDE